MRERPAIRRAAWLLVLPAALHMTSAHAQDMSPGAPPDAAGSRPQPDYDPMGIRFGTVEIRPRVVLSAAYDSNLFATPEDAKSDFSYILAPSISVVTSKDRRSVSLNGSARIRRYDKFEGQNDQQYFVSGAGRLNFGDHGNLQAAASWSRATAARGTYLNTLQQGSPLREERLTGSVTSDYRINRLRINARMGAEKFSFNNIRLDDGTVLDQNFRDGTRINSSVAAYYAVSARLSLLVRGSVEKFDFQDPNPTRNRDALGYSVTAGGLYEITELFSAELAAGYRRHNFKNPLYKDIPGLALTGRLRWYPTPLITVRADLSQTNDTSTLPLVTAVNVSTAVLSTDYELRRNIILSGRLQYSHERFAGVGVNSDYMSASARGNWKLNRWLQLGADLTYDRRTSEQNAPISKFDAFRGMLSVTLAR